MADPNEEKKPGRMASVGMNLTPAGRTELGTIIDNSSRFLNVEPARTDEEVAERLNDLFQSCLERNDIPTVEKMALCLGVSRHAIGQWERDVAWRGTQRGALIRRAKQALHSIESDLAMRGHIPASVYMFRAKNYFGMSDSPDNSWQESVQESGSVDTELIIKKYTEGLPTPVIVDGEPVPNE